LERNPGSHLSTASIIQIAPKVIRRAYFGHAGILIPVMRVVLGIMIPLVLPAGNVIRLAHLHGVISVDMGGRAIGPLFACLMTLPARNTPPEYWVICPAQLGLGGDGCDDVRVRRSSDSRGSRQQRRGDRGGHERRNGADARGVLDERLASGEIDGAEYQRLRGLIAAGEDQSPAGSASRG